MSRMLEIIYRFRAGLRDSVNDPIHPPGYDLCDPQGPHPWPHKSCVIGFLGTVAATKLYPLNFNKIESFWGNDD